jgi:hypothetical protein
MMAEKNVQDQQSETPPRRRAYTSPRLIEYGSVAKLTRGSRSVDADGGSGGFRTMSR